MLQWLKPHVAALISTSRGFLAAVACVMIVAAVWWPEQLEDALWCIALAAITVPLDGRVARYLQASRVYWPAKTPEQMEEFPSHYLFVGVPVAIFLNLLITWDLHRTWANAAPWIAWGTFSLFFLWMTLTFNKAKVELRGIAAERAEVAQAWFAGLITLACAFVVSIELQGLEATLQWQSVSKALVVALLVFGLSGQRQFNRPQERVRGAYRHGTMTWRQFLDENIL